MTERKIEYWDRDDAEYLNHTEKDEAIYAIIDNHQEFTGEIDLYGWARREVKEDIINLADNILISLMETLDENYGGPDEPTDTTKEMQNISEEFVKKIISLYVPWQCEVVTKETVDVEKWVKENAPEWIK